MGAWQVVYFAPGRVFKKRRECRDIVMGSRAEAERQAEMRKQQFGGPVYVGATTKFTKI